MTESAQTSRLTYRGDIDGLRALAVLAVIGFHVSPQFVPGGFVGVDVFFVISGFLISGLLFAEFRERDAFDAFEFYARRIRRILPALILVLVACWGLGWLVLVQSEFEQLQLHIAGASVFIPNFVLWSEAGYFDRPSEFKPLLHLWSLGIEEQFYLLWPPLAYFWWKRRLNLLSLAILIVAASFALNVVFVGSYGTATFYLPHSRIWELLVGAVLAYAHALHREPIDAVIRRFTVASEAHADRRLVANALAWTGLCLVGAAVVGLAKAIEYPGWWVLAPTIGTALLIVAGRDAFLNRAILARRGLVFIGLISYPWYLWHWPLLAFVRITESGRPSFGLSAGAVVLSFLAAWMTFVIVERPVRRTVSVRTPVRVVAIAVLLLAIGAGSFAMARSSAMTSRTPQFATEVDSFFPSPRFDPQCNRSFPTNGEYCQQYAAAPKVTTALIGDSHAEHYLHGVGARLVPRGENVVHLGQSGCPPLFGIERITPYTPDRCEANASILEHVGGNTDLTRVLLAFRGAADVTERGFAPFDNPEIRIRLRGSSVGAADAVRRSLSSTVEYFLARGKTVWLLLHVPELDFVVDECAGRPFSFEHQVRSPCGVSKARVLERQAPYRAIVEDVRRQLPALNIFDPLPSLCDEQWCFAVRGGQLLYMDHHHLSRAGSFFFADKFPF